MSAREYCGDDFMKASEFSELCLAAQFRLMIQIMFIPFTVVGNVLIIATIILLKHQLNTPHDFIIFALAVVDLIIGGVIGPMHLIESFPDNNFLEKAYTWECAVFYSIYHSVDFVAFDLLTLMCVDRWLMVCKPIWHKTHIRRRRIIIAIACILAFRATHVIISVIVTSVQSDRSDYYYPNHGCVGYVYPAPLNGISLFVFLALELFPCIGLCIATVRIASRQLKEHNRKASLASMTMREGNKILRFNAIFMLSMVFVFLMLWLPGSISATVYFFTKKLPNIVFDLTRLIRWTNSGTNAPLYAMTRHVYKMAFKFLLTTPPWRWRSLRKVINSNENEKERNEGRWVTRERSRTSLFHDVDDDADDNDDERSRSILEAHNPVGKLSNTLVLIHNLVARASNPPVAKPSNQTVLIDNPVAKPSNPPVLCSDGDKHIIVKAIHRCFLVSDEVKGIVYSPFRGVQCESSVASFGPSCSQQSMRESDIFESCVDTPRHSIAVDRKDGSRIYQYFKTWKQKISRPRINIKMNSS